MQVDVLVAGALDEEELEENSLELDDVCLRGRRRLARLLDFFRLFLICFFLCEDIFLGTCLEITLGHAHKNEQL